MRKTYATALAALALLGCSSNRAHHAGCGAGRACVTNAAPACVPGPDENCVVAMPAAPAALPETLAPVAEPLVQVVPEVKVETPEPKPEPVIVPVSKLPEAEISPEETLRREAEQRGWGHGPKYGWLVGTLQRVHMPGGDWKLRYLPLSEQDPYGGSMVVALDARFDEFKSGDVVYVEGEVIANRPSLYLSGPLYRVMKIRHIPEHNRTAASEPAARQ